MKNMVFLIFLNLLISGCTNGSVSRMSATFRDTPPVLAQEFHNNGSGFDISGAPVGDSLVAVDERGGRPNGGFSPSIINNEQSARAIDGNRDIVCHRAEERNNNYAVWRPVEVDFNPLKTSFLTAMSVDPNMTVRLIFAENNREISSGFTPSSSDFSVLEIGDNALWAWEIGKSFSGHSDVFRRRIGDYHTPEPRRGGETTGNVVSVTFNRESGTCNVSVGGSGSPINENLDPEFCNVSNSSSEVVLAVQAVTSSSTSSQFFCISAMIVNSFR